MQRAARIATVAAGFFLLASPLPAERNEQVAQASVDAAAIEADPGTARIAIDRANRNWLAAYRSGDTDGMASIYTPDASMFPPGDAILEGPADIVGYLQAQREQGMDPPAMTTSDVVIMGTNAYEVGTYRFSYSGGQARENSGKYFAIWKVQPDGSWRYHVGILTPGGDRS